MARIPVIYLMGPTASGKTDLALKISRAFPCEIISVDSVMIYRGLDIGSAKPSKAVLRDYPHHLIDILDPAQAYSAANFRVDALRVIRQAHARKHIPLLVGGTMLYFRALQRGLSQLPSANPQIRKKLSDLAALQGWEYMHTRLQQVDPDIAARIHPNDPQRIQRALEVYELTGIPMSDWHTQPEKLKHPLQVLKLALIPLVRGWLHQRVEQRFTRMLADGFLAEMQALFGRGDLRADLLAMRAVGYRQGWKYFTGEYDLETMCDKAIIATRQLAKRQLTWLRGDTQVASFPAEQYNTHDIFNKIHSHVR